MNEFFNETPTHRLNYPIYSTYSQYRIILREDFKNRCAYCCDLDRYKISNFAIDHFIPRNPKGFKSTIPDNQYDNLIYSCSYCNRFKSNKWPTLDISKENDGIKGFVKPTNETYRNLFYRSSTGNIFPKQGNELAKYIWTELKLGFPIHSLMWRIERLFLLDRKIRDKLSQEPNAELKEIHYEVTDEIVKIFNDIFDQNI